jgi:hypothetical protein
MARPAGIGAERKIKNPGKLACRGFLNAVVASLGIEPTELSRA